MIEVIKGIKRQTNELIIIALRNMTFKKIEKNDFWRECK